jgi:hypothetical protein
VTLRLGRVKVNAASVTGTAGAGSKARSAEVIQGVTAGKTLPDKSRTHEAAPVAESIGAPSELASIHECPVVGRRILEPPVVPGAHFADNQVIVDHLRHR